MSNSLVTIGIDPGLSGALAIISPQFTRVRPLPVMPAGRGGNKHELDAAELNRMLQSYRDDTVLQGLSWLVVVEAVHSMPAQGISSAFTFGETLGGIKAVIRAMRLPLQMVTPQRWKKTILAGTQHDKAAAIAYAKSKYPNVSLRRSPACRTDDDGMAEALCIAEFGHTTAIATDKDV